MIKILFICHGDICRSPMAEFVMKDMAAKAGVGERFVIDSAATSTEELGNPVYPPARQELAAHGIATYYYNNKKRGELDFVIELGGKVLPIEVKSGKDYETHRALSNIMDCGQYDLSEAVVFNNANLRVAGKIVYAPVYMAMFLEKDDTAPTFYKVDLTGL